MAKKNTKKQLVEFADNEWERCFPLTENDMSMLEKRLNLNLPDQLRKLFLKCNGGLPLKTFYSNKKIEVELGSILPISPPTNFRGESFETVFVRLRDAGHHAELVPFGYDTGNAGIYCINIKTNGVVYWVHDEPEDPIKEVAPSLMEFLEKLRTPPY